MDLSGTPPVPPEPSLEDILKDKLSANPPQKPRKKRTVTELYRKTHGKHPSNKIAAKAMSLETENIKLKRQVKRLSGEVPSFIVEPWMIQMLDMSLHPDTKLSIRGRCEAVGITYDKWTKWANDEDFQIWYGRQVQKRMGGAILPHVHMTIARKAIAGSYQHDKLFLERWDPGYVPSQKVSVETAPPPLIITMTEEDEKDPGLFKYLKNDSAIAKIIDVETADAK